jgi:hypothetical protein
MLSFFLDSIIAVLIDLGLSIPPPKTEEHDSDLAKKRSVERVLEKSADK